MYSKTLFLILVCFLFALPVITAQKIVVKGVTPRGKVVKKTPVQPTYNILQLTGKWQETRRKVITSNTKVGFTDTLQLNFNKRDSVIVRDGISMSQKGYASVDGNKLQVAGDAYIIISLTKNILVINDGEYIREFHKRKIYYHETLGKIIIPKENLSDPVIVDLKKVMGKWVVYRTQATPGVVDDSAIIKNLNFSTVNEDNSVTGEITFTKANITESHPIKAIFEKGTMLIKTLNHSWILNTYKASDNELVFGQQGGMVYFAKQF